MMKPIDFSCKHNVWIRSEDGSLQRMDEPYYRTELIGRGTWRILSDGDYSYLVEGDREAMLIDSGYGCGNIRAFCQGLTDKPLNNIVNTHHHFDHTANNCYFERAFMSEETRPLATIPFPSFEGIDFPKDYEVEVIGEGHVFDLGNRTLETFKIPDHAPGSLAFLDRRERILFSGDELGDPSGKRLNGSVRHWRAQVEKLMRYRGEFDRIWGGAGGMAADVLDRDLRCLDYILEGHEGSPFVPPKRNLEIETDQEGNIIWDRKIPRAMDKKKFVPDIEFKRVMDYGGGRIIYDVRNIE